MSKTTRTSSGLSDYVLFIERCIMLIPDRIRSLWRISEKGSRVRLAVTSALVLMSTFTNGFGYSACAGAATAECAKRPAQIRFGYWNDNFPIDSIFGKSLNRGKDDNVTAAFILQSGWKARERFVFFDIFHSIITNKSHNYRTDVVITRLLMRKMTHWGSYAVGGGILGNNNFGGEFLQNGYHSLTGIRKLEQPYLRDNRIGLTIYTDIKTQIYADGGNALFAAFSHSYRHALLPSFGKAGLEYGIEKNVSGGRGRSGFRLYAGYVEHYDKKKYFRKMFDDGVTSGAMLTHGVPEKYHVSVFLTLNQYGLRQPHFGLLFVWNWRENMRFDLSDISFL